MIKFTASAVAAVSLLAATSIAVAATGHSGSMARSGSSTLGITKAKAMKEIQTDGYTNVQDLRKDKGGWTADAMESGKQVSLHIDSLGNVRKQ